jgi:aspartate/methionine/tyrosine aminotransferase
VNVQWTRQRVGELSGMRERMWSVVSRLAPGTVRTKGAFYFLLRLPEGVTEEEAVRVLATKVKVLVTPGRYVIFQESPHFHVELVSPCLRVNRAFYDLWASRVMWLSLCVCGWWHSINLVMSAAGVVLCSAFGAPGHLRVSYGSLPPSECASAIDRLEEGLEILAKKGRT